MKKKVISILLCLILVMSMFSGCSKENNGKDVSKTNETSDSNTGSNADNAQGAAKYKDFITVDVFDSQANYQGIQSGWFAKIIKDKFNMELNIIAPNVAGGGDTLLQTRSAAGNLGDLIFTSTASGRLQDLVTAGLVQDMTNLMKGKENLAKYQDAVDFTNKKMVKDPGVWAIPSEVSERPATTRMGGTTLNFGTYIRWDLYKQLGYPKMSTLEDLLPVMKNMQDMAGKSDSGKKVYAFSIFKDWDGDFMKAANEMASMYGYAPMGFVYAKADDSAEPQSALDDDSLYIRGLKFYFQANQMGLLDPESTTQNYDTLSNKYKDGAVLYSPWPWLSSAYNTTEHTSAGKAFNTAAIDDFKLYAWGCYSKGNPNNAVMIGSKAKDPQRLMDFIDWLYSPEGLEVAYAGSISGIKDLMWNVVDGKPALTDFGYQCMTNGDKTAMPEEYGGGNYADGIERLNYKVVGDGEINPETGFSYNYQFWDSYVNINLTDVEKDWQAHMKAKNAAEFFDANKQIVVSPGSGYAVPSEKSDITTIRSQIKSTIVEYSWKAVFAKDEAEFNKLIKDMKDTAIGLGYNDVIAIDKANVEQQKQERIAVSK
ncbi:putative aldouronate transport system substrate-binding protein [Anaerocolumna jejuensis DSM 15929]|uniref:Putative aldouronate transport system substrate-binding protein n=1 Tax=Anaerocolumna jejuensis DSM 15929 TaxID=1121322 RepID=A0A1M6L1Q2_9FIRM|nr:ABC transporter substrate-binding protein [Anaerocolumna jejuensis]SHJ65150.1 putative aldouronate transport system substrate-binding protein [Anaerocolumna jejuensis DSM 15929]